MSLSQCLCVASSRLPRIVFAATPTKCSAPVGGYCRAGTTSVLPCPSGLYCAGGNAQPVPVACTSLLSGSRFNLTGLMRTSAGGGWVYSVSGSSYYINFCGDTPDRALCLDSTMSQGAGVCQLQNGGAYNLGVTSSAAWSILDSTNPCAGVVYTVSQGDPSGGCSGPRKSIISLACDPTVPGLSFTSLNENPTCTCVLCVFSTPHLSRLATRH